MLLILLRGCTKIDQVVTKQPKKITPSCRRKEGDGKTPNPKQNPQHSLEENGKERRTREKERDPGALSPHSKRDVALSGTMGLSRPGDLGCGPLVLCEPWIRHPCGGYCRERVPIGARRNSFHLPKDRGTYTHADYYKDPPAINGIIGEDFAPAHVISLRCRLIS